MRPNISTATETWTPLSERVPESFLTIWLRLRDGSEWRGYYTGWMFVIGGLTRPEVTHWKL